MSLKAAIISQLQNEILRLQGFKKQSANTAVDMGLGPIRYAFPNAVFPLGAIHEFCSEGAEDETVSSGFIAGIIASLMKEGGLSIWISASTTIFPPALISFGLDPDKVIFINLKKEKDKLWAFEEALKCEGLSAVVGVIKEINFTSSRRLQLAVEKSKVTGFILRVNSTNLSTTAFVSRWKITSLPATVENDLPGVGFPRWNVALLKIRNGKPGSWQVEWLGGRFRHLPIIDSSQKMQQKKAG